MPRPDPRRWGSRVLGVPLIVLTLFGCSAEDERCQVTGADSVAESEVLRESCERAVPEVEALWPGWSGPVPIVRSQSALPPGVAAQVEGSIVPGHPAEADRLLVGPALVERLSPDGLDVVMRHELTHLAMRSTGTAPVPSWASEGLAEYAGYQGVDDDRKDRRGDLRSLRELVDNGGWAGTLPTAADLQDSQTRADAYAAAWLGITVLIDELGPQAVTEAMRPVANERADHRVVHSEAEQTERFLQRLGVSRPWLDQRWLSELERRTA